MAGKSRHDSFSEIQLQAKRREDNAWYDCKVSLSCDESLGIALHVHFGSLKDGDSDTISWKKEAFDRIRVRSTEILGGECHEIKEGEIVMAFQKVQTGRNQFFDAKVEKVQRAKHSNRMVCRCSFEILWLEGGKKGETDMVSASLIRRLSKESIKIHPIISAFMRTALSMENLQPPDDLKWHSEDVDGETDIHAQLEQQIDEIAKLAESVDFASLEDLSFHHVKVDGQYNNRKVSASADKTTFCKDGSRHETSNESPASRNKTSLTTLNEEKFLDSISMSEMEGRPRLSPLAARAALAASVWEMPLPEDSPKKSKGVYQTTRDKISRSNFQRQNKHLKKTKNHGEKKNKRMRKSQISLEASETAAGANRLNMNKEERDNYGNRVEKTKHTTDLKSDQRSSFDSGITLKDTRMEKKSPTHNASVPLVCCHYKNTSHSKEKDQSGQRTKEGTTSSVMMSKKNMKNMSGFQLPKRKLKSLLKGRVSLKRESDAAMSDMEIGTITKVRKRIADVQATRSSPRLRFLPRTRSQRRSTSRF